MYVNNLQSVLPSCANIADCSGWAPPNLPPLGWGGRGAPEERLSLSPPLRPGESCIRAFLSSCMEIIPIGGNCFPSKREEAAGCPVGEGPWGRPRAGASSWGAGGTGSPLQLLISSQGLLDAPHSQDETSCPLVPPQLPRLLSPPLLPLIPHRARSCHGVSQELPGGCLVVLGSEPCPGSCPLCCLGHRLRGLLAISYSSHVLLP